MSIAVNIGAENAAGQLLIRLDKALAAHAIQQPAGAVRAPRYLYLGVNEAQTLKEFAESNMRDAEFGRTKLGRLTFRGLPVLTVDHKEHLNVV